MSIERVIKGIRELEAERTKYRKKLESIKSHIKIRPISHLNPPHRDPVACIGFDDGAVFDWMKELEKILEDER